MLVKGGPPPVVPRFEETRIQRCKKLERAAKEGRLKREWTCIYP